jgi:hypothetical protein
LDRAQRSDAQKRYESLVDSRRAQLDARRDALHALLSREDAALREELLASAEKPEQRRSRLAQRARELAVAREAERAALAAQLLDRAFQEGCDMLRTKNSQRVFYRTLEERRQQARTCPGMPLAAAPHDAGEPYAGLFQQASTCQYRPLCKAVHSLTQVCVLDSMRWRCCKLTMLLACAADRG